jgi:putative ABC transport system ATP-binding protein
MNAARKTMEELRLSRSRMNKILARRRLQIPSVIKIRSLTKTFVKNEARLVVLDHIDLEIARGEFVMVLGESGSGKTTLLNVLGAIDTADSGEITVGGFGDILSGGDERLSEYIKTRGHYIMVYGSILSAMDKKLAVYRNRVVGHIFQTFNLKKSYTAYANVKVPLLFSDVSVRDAHQRIMRALDRVGLGERPHFRPPELSEGQCQRVAIARAIVNEPQILLADEPTGNLDPKTARKIMQLLVSLNREQGTTLLMVTHDISMLEYAQKTVTLEGGKVAVMQK